MAMRKLFRVRSFKPIMDTLEVLLSATADTLFGVVMEHAQSFEGFGLAIDLEGQFQRVEASLFSKLITPEGGSKALDMPVILKNPWRPCPANARTSGRSAGSRRQRNRRS
jgi:hypothetical protein